MMPVRLELAVILTVMALACVWIASVLMNRNPHYAVKGVRAKTCLLLNRLDGWQRIGVVMSFAWLVFVVGVTAFEPSRTRKADELFVISLLPILALWGGAYLLVAVARWVAAGFKGSTAGGRVSGAIRRRVELPVWALVAIVLLSVAVGAIADSTQTKNDGGRYSGRNSGRSSGR